MSASTKKNLSNLIFLGAAIVFSLIALIIYSINSTTGVMQTVKLDVVPIVLTVLAIILMGSLIIVKNKFSHWVNSLVLLVAVVLLAISACLLIFNRTDIAGNQWFIPGLATEDQGTCLTIAIVGLVFYGLGMLSLIVTAFAGNLEKK